MEQGGLHVFDLLVVLLAHLFGYMEIDVHRDLAVAVSKASRYYAQRDALLCHKRYVGVPHKVRGHIFAKQLFCVFLQIFIV